jgi:hypothetical protein
MRVVVLNDGETYTDIRGCTVLYVPENVSGDNVDAYVKNFSDTGTQVSELLAAWERSVR